MSKTNKKQIISVILSVLVSVVAVAGVAYAVTSIGDAVSIGTTLTVTATSTLNGNVVLGNSVNDTLTVYAPLVWAATTTTYGIDLNAATSSSADIRLQNGETIDNITDGTIALSAATTTFNGNVTLGDAATDTTIVNGRISTLSKAGSDISVGSTYAYDEGVKMRYLVTDWTGKGDFKGYYFRAQANTASSSRGLTGMQVYGVSNVASSTGLANLQSLYAEMLVKDTGYDTTITNANTVEANISIDSQTGTLTFTNDVYALKAKVQTGNSGSDIADFTKLNGIAVQGRADSVSRTYGNAIAVVDPEATVATWTKGLSISAAATTGISLTGAMTTGISLANTATTGIDMDSATLTTDIKLQSGATIDNASNGVVTINGNTGTNRVDIYGNLKIVSATTTIVTGSNPGSMVKLQYEFTESIANSPQGMQVVATYGSSTAATSGGLTGLEVKARNKQSVGGALGTIRGLVVTADSKDRTVTTMKGAEIQVSGLSGANVPTAMALNVVNQLDDVGTYGNIYGISIQADQVANTADIQLSGGAGAATSTRPLIMSGAGAPTGACIKGSIYLNSSATASSTAVYACINTAWEKLTSS